MTAAAATATEEAAAAVVVVVVVAAAYAHAVGGEALPRKDASEHAWLKAPA